MFHETALFLAVSKENYDIVHLLTSCDKIDYSIINVFITFFNKIIEY